MIILRLNTSGLLGDFQYIIAMMAKHIAEAIIAANEVA